MYNMNEQQLVSFGNWLLKEYGVMVMSDNGKNTPLYQREVSHADICNYKEVVDFEITRLLPSAHQLGDKVFVSFGAQGIIKNCEVIKIHFTESKVLYDLEVSGDYEEPMDGRWSTRLYNVDSLFVEKD